MIIFIIALVVLSVIGANYINSAHAYIKNYHTDKIPLWLLKTLKVLLFGIITALVVIGTLSMLIGVIAMTTDTTHNKK